MYEQYEQEVPEVATEESENSGEHEEKKEKTSEASDLEKERAEEKENERKAKNYKSVLEQLYKFRELCEKKGLTGDPAVDWRILEAFPEHPFTWKESDGRKITVSRSKASGFVHISQENKDGSAERWEIDSDGTLQKFELPAPPPGKERSEEEKKAFRSPERWKGSPALTGNTDPKKHRGGKLLGLTQTFLMFIKGIFGSSKK